MPTAKVNGTEIFYRDAGGQSRDVVLLLHAFPLHSGMWSRQIAALEKRHRVIAPDYRGLGKSAPPREPSTMELLAADVRALLAHLRVERAGVAGLSVGGYLAFELYRQAPGLFRVLALCDTRAGADTPEGAAGREKFAQTATEKGLTWVAEDMIPKLLRPKPDPAAVKEVHSLIAQGSPAGVAAAQRGMAKRPDSFPTLATIACPTLVVVGEEDGLTPPAESEKMAAAVKGARLVRIPAAGHLPNVENPEPFTQALAEFFGSLPA
ncbi:MAG TPA: alpha/beta fold hydrolase [Anaeromyxobacteraceae bacterium]|nr:alpha/beta fold hydrolase [Anaeromyxobacteraceae bacterium]